MGCSPWGHWESDSTERLDFHFSLSCIGEGNDNPHQYFCLEDPRAGGAWWAAIYGVAQSQTWLKRLSSSSSLSKLSKSVHCDSEVFFLQCVLVAHSCLTLCNPIAHQAPLSMGFSRPEQWSGLSFPPPGDLPDPGIKLCLFRLLYCRQILYHLCHQGYPEVSLGLSIMLKKNNNMAQCFKSFKCGYEF